MFVLFLLSCRPKLVLDDSPAALDSVETAVDSVPCTLSTWYSDADGDGHGDLASAVDACEATPDQVVWVSG